MAEKRRTSSRLRSSPPNKKRATPPVTPKPTPPKPVSAPKPSAPPLPPNPLTLKPIEGRPLPILSTPQDISDLPDSKWLSVIDSGVLAASLARSRRRWLDGSILERYWSKTDYKKKGKDGTPIVTKAQEGQMRKHGTARLVIEPHIFEVTLWLVKETAPPVVNTPGTGTGYTPYGQPPRPGISYGTRLNHPNTPTPGGIARPGTSTGAPQPQTYPQNRPMPPVQPGTPTPTTAPRPTVPYQTPQPQTQTPQPPRQVTHVPPPQPAPAASGPAPDPVIALLATRAGTNLELKRVMKIVASGSASQRDLEYFQRHINELTEYVKRKEALGQPVQGPATPAQPATAPQPKPPATSQGSTPRGGSPYTAQKAAPVRELGVKHVLIEFKENASDRFLLPSNASVKYESNGKVAAVSAAIVQRGSRAEDRASGPEGKAYDPVKEYHQSVKLAFEGNEAILSVLAKVCKEVEVKGEGAREAYLALRLMKEG